MPKGTTLEPQDIAAIVREAMAERVVTNYWLQEQTGIPRQTIGNFVRRGKRIGVQKLALVLAALDLEIVRKEARK